jgi:DNA (cytosine-5)-methyltransferase 1
MNNQRKIGLNRGKRRIWLEGVILSSNGFNQGDRFDVIHEDNVLTIIKDTNGKRKVAGKPNRPIIDMSASTVTDSFEESVLAVDITLLDNDLVLTGV